ncbi:MAG: hypothetical protein ACRD9L_16525 [Bryobacteraceae bacterium]
MRSSAKWSFPPDFDSIAKRSLDDKPFFDTNIILYGFRQDDTRGPVAEALLASGGSLPALDILRVFWPGDRPAHGS